MPNEASWLQHCITVQHYLDGAAYPVGGPQTIAQAVAPIVESRGGKALTMANVISLIVDDGNVGGVYLKGYGPVKATRVISAVGAYNTFMMIPDDTALVIPEIWRGKKALESGNPPPSVAHAMAFISLNGSKEELGLPSANIWYELFRECWMS